MHVIEKQCATRWNKLFYESAQLWLLKVAILGAGFKGKGIATITTTATTIIIN